MHYSRLVPTTFSGQLAMKLSKLSIILATVVFASAQVHANEGAGANAATGSAVGGVSTGVVVAAVAGIAVVAALTSGDSGTAEVAGTAKTASENSAAAAASAAVGATQAAAANAQQELALAEVKALVEGNVTLTDAYNAAFAAIEIAKNSAAEAKVAAANLAAANKLGVSAAVCAAATTCTKAELANLSYKAAYSAKLAAEHALYAHKLLLDLRAALVTFNIAIPANFDTAIARSYTAALASQTAANEAIVSYRATLTALGITGTSIATSSGTTGTSGTTGSIKF
ncbi:hypothetical protein MCEMIEM12_00442 [Burkholderiaceae bacterium]